MTHWCGYRHGMKIYQSKWNSGHFTLSSQLTKLIGCMNLQSELERTQPQLHAVAGVIAHGSTKAKGIFFSFIFYLPLYILVTLSNISICYTTALICSMFLQEALKKLRMRTEEVIQENEKLHAELSKRSSVSNKEW